MSNILKVPNEITPTPPEMLFKLTKQLPDDTNNSFYREGAEGGSGGDRKAPRNNAEKFDLRNWLCEHQINVRESVSYKGGTKYILECCPFDESHTGKDAAVFQLASGAVGFKCLHNSCAHYNWRDFREKFEPNAYK